MRPGGKPAICADTPKCNIEKWARLIRADLDKRETDSVKSSSELGKDRHSSGLTFYCAY